MTWAMPTSWWWRSSPIRWEPGCRSPSPDRVRRSGRRWSWLRSDQSARASTSNHRCHVRPASKLPPADLPPVTSTGQHSSSTSPQTVQFITAQQDGGRSRVRHVLGGDHHHHHRRHVRPRAGADPGCGQVVRFDAQDRPDHGRRCPGTAAGRVRARAGGTEAPDRRSAVPQGDPGTALPARPQSPGPDHQEHPRRRILRRVLGFPGTESGRRQRRGNGLRRGAGDGRPGCGAPGNDPRRDDPAGGDRAGGDGQRSDRSDEAC